MASAQYLDEIEGLNKLPEELNRNFSLMKDLDTKSHKLMTEIDKMADNYMSNIKKYSENQKKQTMASIQCKFDAAKELSDDKVQIAIQNYALVDKRIRQLDLVMSQYEEQIKLKAGIQEAALEAKKNINPKKGGSKKTRAPPLVKAITDSSNSINSIDNVSEETSSLSGVLDGAGIPNSVYVDMPIDPNEPTFCLCKQVSFGEMICCDNLKCAIEWFHFECVSLITKPKGKWFCPQCLKDKNKK